MSDTEAGNGCLDPELLQGGKGATLLNGHGGRTASGHSFSTGISEGVDEHVVSTSSESPDIGQRMPSKESDAVEISSPQPLERPIHSEKSRPSWVANGRPGTPPILNDMEKRRSRASLQEGERGFFHTASMGLVEGIADFGQTSGIAGLLAEENGGTAANPAAVRASVRGCSSSEESGSETFDTGRQRFHVDLPARPSKEQREEQPRRGKEKRGSIGEALVESLVDGVAVLWPDNQEAAPRRSTAGSSKAPGPPTDDRDCSDSDGAKEGLTAKLKRASLQISQGIGGLLGVAPKDSEEAREAQPSVGDVHMIPRRSLHASHSSSINATPSGASGSTERARTPISFQAAARGVMLASRLTADTSTTVDIQRLLREARRPFRRLIVEVQKPQVSCTRGANGVTEFMFGSGAAAPGEAASGSGGGGASGSAEVNAFIGDGEAGETPQSRDAQARSPLLSAIVRARLIGYVLGCCEAVCSELSTDESKLWDAFVAADSTLTATISVRNHELRQVLMECFGQCTEDWCATMDEIADENGNIDFADLMEWHTQTSKVETIWFTHNTVRASIVAGLAQVMNSSAARHTAPRMRAERISELRSRCAKMTPEALAEAAVAYQRSLMLTSCWQCETRLTDIIQSAAAPANGDQRAPPPSPVHTLLSILRSINSELAPTERVLWEVIGSKDKDFDGGFTKPEVLAGIGELLVYTLERELATPSEEFEELQKLRSECQRRSVEGLFQDKRLTVTISDIIWWWWDLPEEYRIAAGLSVPAALLKRSVTRKPEEMFKDKLRLAATNAQVANTALRGHVRAYAELRALLVRRTIEGLHCHSPTATWTTTTSDAGDGASRATSEPNGCRSRDEDVEEGEDDEVMQV